VKRPVIAAMTLCLVVALMGSAVVAQDLTPQALAATMPRSTLASESIYFVMTDRYANGSPANDRGAGISTGGFNPRDTGLFHGGDFVGLAANLDRIKRLGFTALWLTPPFVQNAVQGNSAAYHGYWGLDFTDVDPHFGTEAEFAALVAKAHGLGLKVYLDIVVNHTGDIIQYRDGNSFVTGRVKQPFIPEGSPKKKPEWLNRIENYNNRGDASSCGWSGKDCIQNGDFFGLDDIKTSNPEVVTGWIDVYADWIRRYRIDGFRIDTAKHVDDAFFPVWTPPILEAAREAGSEDFSMFGEFYEGSAAALSAYMRRSTLPSALDFASQEAVVGFAARPGSAKQMARWLAQDDLYNRGDQPDGVVRNAYGLVTFGGNHDMGRIGLLVASASLDLGKPLLQRVKLAHSLLFLTRGAPAVYYGDEVGMMGSDGDKAARQDMFATAVVEWQQEYRIGSAPIGRGSSLTSAAERHPLSVHLRSLNALRRSHPALRDGAIIPRVATGSVMAWSRIDASTPREYVVAANSGDRSVSVTIQTSSARSTFVTIFGGKARAPADGKGLITLNIPARSSLVLRASSALPKVRAVPAVSISKGRDAALAMQFVSAKVGSTTDPMSVTFIQRSCATCAWQRLGVDDAAPFRFYVEPGAFGPSTSMEVVAVARTSDGRTRVSSPVTLNR
jgi:glycosidase